MLVYFWWQDELKMQKEGKVKGEWRGRREKWRNKKKIIKKKKSWEGKDLSLSYHHYVRCGKWEQKFDMASFHGYDWQ